MKASDIKVGNIYYVDFEPSRKKEFNGHHMALVLKKNINEITFIVIPMTSNKDGIGKNKISLGVIESLPERLKADNHESYAVYDQVRTINASRFSNIISDKGEIMEATLDKDKLTMVYKAIIKNLIYDLDDKIKDTLKQDCFE